MNSKEYWESWNKYLSKHDLTPFYIDPVAKYSDCIMGSEREKWLFYNYIKTHEIDLLGLRCSRCGKKLTEIHARRMVCEEY